MKDTILKAMQQLEEAIDNAINTADNCVLDSDDETLDSEYYDLIFPADGKALLPEDLATKLQKLREKHS